MFDNHTFATICNYAKKMFFINNFFHRNFLSERLQSELSEKANDNCFHEKWSILGYTDTLN